MSITLVLFTLFHVAISLVAIASGFIVLLGLLMAKRLDGWTAIFLATTVATSVTGFMFPVHHFMPSHAVGIVSLLVLTVAIFARYRRRLHGAWRTVYVISAMISLYANVFVLVAQAFMKLPLLKPLAPAQFAAAQLTIVALFVLLIVAAVIRFRIGALQPDPFLVQTA